MSPELMIVAERALGQVEVCDIGLVESAVTRPMTSAFGEDAYPSIDLKAAALVHSIARNHALVDGNERLALAGLIAFYGMNGRSLTFSNDQAYDFVLAIAAGELDEVGAIAAVLAEATEPR